MAINEKHGGWKKLKQVLPTLSWPERFEYLWEYYKWVLIVAFFVISILCVTVSTIKNASMENLFGGTLVNIHLTDEGEAYLSTGWLEVLEGNPRKQEVTLMSTYFEDPTLSTTDEYAYAAAMSPIILIGVNDLDYMLLDQASANYYLNKGIYPPLDTVLTEEQLAAFADKIVCGKDVDGNEGVPLAIDISDIPFIQDCLEVEGPVYITFPGNTPRLELSAEFFDYLLAWGT